MRADDISLFLLHAVEIPQRDEFRERFFADVEDAEEGDAVVGGGARVERADFEEAFALVGGVDACFDAFGHRVGAEDAGCFLDCWGGHGVDEGDVVLAGCVGYVDGAAGDAAGGGVEGGVWVRCLTACGVRLYVGEGFALRGQGGRRERRVRPTTCPNPVRR